MLKLPGYITIDNVICAPRGRILRDRYPRFRTANLNPAL